MGKALREANVMPPNYFERLARMEAELEQHPDIVDLKAEYPDYDLKNNKKTELYNYARNCDNCRTCQGLEDCKNEFPGHRLMPDTDPLFKGTLLFRLLPCNLQQAVTKQQKIKQMIKSHHMPASIAESSFDNLDVDTQRQAAITECMKFCLDFKEDETVKGLYLYGNMGVGKSRIAGAIAHELAQRSVAVALVYVPDFMEEVKGAIATNTVSEKLDAIRDVDVLILDDIGAEPLTTWTRDEVLGPVLQRRMERKVTLYTSNLTMAELERHLTNVKDFDKMELQQHKKKAARIMERIEPWVKLVHVNGRNRRRSQ
ncbi:primosomal protein DnaI [Paenibacillus alvei]|uniref:Primosomal protein DnaI n=1 Tax=Paenibacillus alvei TaxID=44250 RepID=A0ABT4H708_PAEAL|nr:primosomal protein DnaI [Paenibacillus alvei]MCY9764684.1 primosomal protein DnaI [Paenibacillus alvei]MCY9770899.1 primosomal protein DnaI [Paenibacillus alvei]